MLTRLLSYSSFFLSNYIKQKLTKWKIAVTQVNNAENGLHSDQFLLQTRKGVRNKATNWRAG